MVMGLQSCVRRSGPSLQRTVEVAIAIGRLEGREAAMGPLEHLNSTIDAATDRWRNTLCASAQIVDFPGSVSHIHNFVDSLLRKRHGNSTPQQQQSCHSQQPELLGSLGRKIRLPFAGIVLSRNERGGDGEREREEEEEESLRTEHQEAETPFEREGLAEPSGRGFNSELLLQLPAQVNSGGAVTKEDLGRATWTFLHTLAAQYPEKPTRQQQRDAKELMSIMTRLYPCKHCAEHFKEVLKAYPVTAGSGAELAQWMCQVHNVVNRSLGKPQFPCARVDARWGHLDCDEGACDLEGRVPYK